ncbi:hypothetical protein [Nannocystis punicea]|uniref:Uncharacterized protein n=1 Tax=Nannocystis punicea TaxID=2995304 RepID=A0ABY7H700_9BACT|nr:hypothetical protein [Nannocystis poenicansa]WAS95052.1 hypothetical protein O0S08_02725 [Nannocystis poenicansa]
MRNAIQSLLNAIDRDPGGVAVVLCPDFGLRDWLVEEVESLVSDGLNVVRVTDVEAALAEPTRLVLLIPGDEREVVLELDASRDRLLQEPVRTQPIVLFLLRDGDGERTLANEAPSLRSWIGGSDADPEELAEIDVPKERATFEAKHGLTPEEWLGQWREGALPQTGPNYRIAYDAMMIERREAS